MPDSTIEAFSLDQGVSLSGQTQSVSTISPSPPQSPDSLLAGLPVSEWDLTTSTSFDLFQPFSDMNFSADSAPVHTHEVSVAATAAEALLNLPMDHLQTFE